MVDVSPPVRSEPLFDEQGNPTIRFAEYLDEVANNINEASDSVEAVVSGAFTEIQKVKSEIHEQNKQLEDLEALIESFNPTALITELRNQLEELVQAVELTNPNARITTLENRLDVLDLIEETSSVAKITTLENRLDTLDELIESTSDSAKISTLENKFNDLDSLIESPQKVDLRELTSKVNDLEALANDN